LERSADFESGIRGTNDVLGGNGTRDIRTTPSQSGTLPLSSNEDGEVRGQEVRQSGDGESETSRDGGVEEGLAQQSSEIGGDGQYANGTSERDTTERDTVQTDTDFSGGDRGDKEDSNNDRTEQPIESDSIREESFSVTQNNRAFLYRKKSSL